MNALGEFLGRFHPAVLHLPIGLAAALVIAELTAVWSRRRLTPELRGFLAGAYGASAAVAGVTGLLLASADGRSGPGFEAHRTFGLLFAAAAATAAGAALRSWKTGGAEGGPVYALALVLSLGFLLPAGHHGGEMTHGVGFLSWPKERATPTASKSSDVAATSAPVTTPTAGFDYAHRIAPILAERCVYCHGPEKQKGGLSLASPELMAKGGDSGPAIDRADPAASLVLRRLRLPADDEEHMPPAKKPQLGADERSLLETWILAGAPTQGPIPLAKATSESPNVAPIAARVAAPRRRAAPASAAALKALADRQVHVQAIAAGDAHLIVDASVAAPPLVDAEVAPLLLPLKDQIVELSLARAKFGDAVGETLATLSALESLDLSETAVTDGIVHHLAGLDRLRRLNLARTKVGGGAIAALAEIASLHDLVVWGSAVDSESLSRLRALRPELRIETGDALVTKVIESETDIKLTSDRAVAKSASQAAAPADPLVPVNKNCPVSGGPVNPAYAVVFEGKTVGFCCPKCPSKVWADPAAYRAKIP